MNIDIEKFLETLERIDSINNEVSAEMKKIKEKYANVRADLYKHQREFNKKTYSLAEEYHRKYYTEDESCKCCVSKSISRFEYYPTLEGIEFEREEDHPNDCVNFCVPWSEVRSYLATGEIDEDTWEYC